MPSVEADVYVWCYAPLVVNARKDEQPRKYGATLLLWIKQLKEKPSIIQKLYRIASNIELGDEVLHTWKAEVDCIVRIIIERAAPLP